MTTAIAQATRESGNVIGNSLKTVFARLNMNKTQEALAEIGVAVKDVNGELRSATSIYADVASRWNSLTRAQKTYVAEALAGKYHITRMMALIENWDTVMQAAETSQNSLGSSMEENRKHMQSLESAINQVKAAGQELAFSIGEGGLRDVMYEVLSSTATLIKGITALLPYLFSWQSAMFGLGIGIASLIPKVGQMIPLLGMLGAAIRALGASLATLLMNPIILATTAIVGLGTAIAYAVGKHKELQEEMQKLGNAANEANKHLKEIEDTLNVIGSTKHEQILDYDKAIDNLTKVKNKLLELKKAQEEYDELILKTNPEAALYSTGDKLDPSRISQELKDLAQTAGVNILQFKTLGEALAAVDQKLKSMSNTSKELKKNDLSSVFDEEGKKIDELTRVLDDMNNKRGYSATQAKELIDKHKELGASLTEVGGKYYFTSEKVQELINKHKDLVRASYENAKTVAEERKKTLLDLVKIYNAEITKIDELILKREQLNNSIVKKVSQMTVTGVDGKKRKLDSSEAKYMALGEQYKIDRQLEDVKKSEEELEKYNKLLNGLGQVTFTNTGSAKKTSSSTKSSSSYAPMTKEAKELLKIETELLQVQTERESLLSSSKEYRNNLENEKNFLRQKLNLLQKEYTQITKTKIINGKIQSNKFPAKLSDDAFKRSNELEQEIIRLQANLNNLSFEQINSQIEEFGQKNEELERQLQIIDSRLSQYPETSQAYRDALNQEINKLKQKQDNLHKTNEYIRSQLLLGKLTQEQQAELRKALDENSNAWLTLQNTINEKKLAQVNSILNEQKEKTDELSKSIELSQAIMDSIGDKSSQQYLDEYSNYLRLIQLKEQSLQAEINKRQELIALHKNEIELVNKLKNEIIDLQIEQLRLRKALEESTVNNIIDLYKSVYEEQKKITLQALDDEIEAENKRHDEKIKHLEDELRKKEKTTQKEIEAIEKQIEAEEERHDKVIKGLDDELERYREVINMRLKSIDREVSEKEYNDEMEQLQKERQRIQEQINVLMLDDSYEAKLKLSELNEQLAEKDKQIEDLAYKRGVELRKDNLQDALEKYEKEVDEKKKAEEEKYNETKKQLENEKKKLDEQLKYYKEYIDKQIEKENEKHEKIIDNLNKEKEATQRHYEQLLADEKRFADLRRAILSGNLNAIQGDLNAFASFIQSNMSQIGQSIANNLLAKIEEAKRAISQLNNVSLPSYGGGGSSGGSGSGGSNQFKDEWKQYKNQVNEIVYNKKMYEQAKSNGDLKEAERRHKIALQYYSQLPSDLRRLLEDMNVDRAYDFYNKYFKGTYHTGGIVGDKSDGLTEMVSKLFSNKQLDLKSNEGFAKVLNGELFVTPKQIAQNFIPNMQRLMSSFSPTVVLDGGSAKSGDTIFNLNIERFTGTESDYNKIANFVMDKIMIANKKRGR